MNMKYCCVVGCTNASYAADRDLSFHR